MIQKASGRPVAIVVGVIVLLLGIGGISLLSKKGEGVKQAMNTEGGSAEAVSGSKEPLRKFRMPANATSLPRGTVCIAGSRANLTLVALRADWSRQFALNRGVPPDEWAFIQERWMEQNRPLIDEVNEALGLEISVRQGGRLDVGPTRQDRSDQGIVNQFELERQSLFSEREKILGQAGGEEERAKFLFDWESENLERLRAHRQKALRLRLPNFDQSGWTPDPEG